MKLRIQSLQIILAALCLVVLIVGCSASPTPTPTQIPPTPTPSPTPHPATFGVGIRSVDNFTMLSSNVPIEINNSLPDEWLRTDGGQVRYEINVLVADNEIERCDYGTTSANTTNSILRQQRTAEIEIIDTESQDTEDSRTFVGEEPDVCPETHRFTSFQNTVYFSGGDPSATEIATWLMETMEDLPELTFTE